MTIIVKDMMCEHCVHNIQKALRKEGIIATVDLASKSVTVNDVEEAATKRLIIEAGYTVE